MKPQQLIFDEPDRMQVVQEATVRSETLMASIVPFKGHTMFEINCTTGEVIPAKYEEVNVHLNGKVRKKIIVNPNCLYISCLNKKSAVKKYIKWLIEKRDKTKK